MTTTTPSVPSAMEGIRPARLFVASCFALISTAITFAVVGDIMGQLKLVFNLTNQDVGYIAGAATWGFTLSIFVLGPLCDFLGMRFLMRFAFLCHAVGVLMMIFANSFWMLFFGGLIISLGNGTVEAACNPLVATIYPTRKTQKLNQFHMWFPGGIVIGGLLAFGISQVNPGLWQLKLATILLPTLVYGVLFAGQKFPLTERVQSGISFGGMVRETLLRPLFLVLLVCMAITASLELGPNRWVPSVLQAGGIHGILVLCYINGLMAILRYFAGPVVHKLSNTGILLLSAILAGLGLVGLSFCADVPEQYRTLTAFATATVFAVGVCYFWPTMLGTAAERVPKGGALALSLLGGMGMLAVGVVTTPQMGNVADKYVHQELVAKQTETVAALGKVVAGYPAYAEKNALDRQEIEGVVTMAKAVVAASAGGTLPTAAPLPDVPELPKGRTISPANAMRAAMKVAPNPKDEAVKKDPVLAAAADAGASVGSLLLPADNHGGLMSFRYVAPLAGVLMLVFGILFIRDKASGGYKPESITH